MQVDLLSTSSPEAVFELYELIAFFWFVAYKQLSQLSQSFAESIRSELQLDRHSSKSPEDNQIVSLLGPTGLDFLVAWIACMGLGLGVVFVA